ncbi:MAG: hypothetical protein RIF41_08535 [Polyangiaceae bacterium]
MQTKHTTIALLTFVLTAGCALPEAPPAAPDHVDDEPTALRAIVRNRGDANLELGTFSTAEARLWPREVREGAIMFATSPTPIGRCESSVTVTVAGDLRPGQTYVLGGDTGVVYIEDCASSSRAWRADEGALEVGAIAPGQWSFSIARARMKPSNHHAIGSFDLSLDARDVRGW